MNTTLSEYTFTYMVSGKEKLYEWSTSFKTVGVEREQATILFFKEVKAEKVSDYRLTVKSFQVKDSPPITSVNQIQRA